MTRTFSFSCVKWPFIILFLRFYSYDWTESSSLELSLLIQIEMNISFDWSVNLLSERIITPKYHWVVAPIEGNESLWHARVHEHNRDSYKNISTQYTNGIESLILKYVMWSTKGLSISHFKWWRVKDCSHLNLRS